MRGRKGFTLIELMVAILIVGILAAVAIPITWGRIDAAKWSEGKSMAGSIATSIRAYAAEKDVMGAYGDETVLTPTMLGFAPGDLNGTYFKTGQFAWDVQFIPGANPALIYTITVTAPAGVSPPTVTLDHTGTWTP